MAILFAMALLPTMPTTTPAWATTIEDYDKLTVQQRGELVGDAYAKIANYYLNKAPDPKKSVCIREFFLRPSSGKPSRGAEVVAEEIDKGRRIHPGDYHVEAIVLGVINRECPDTKPQ